MKWVDVILFLSMATFWSLNYIFLKIALAFQGPFFILTLRVIFALIFTLLLFFNRLGRPSSHKSILKILIFGSLNLTLFMSFWFIGETIVSAGLSAILVYTYPLFVVILSRLFLHERLNRMSITGLVVGFLGVIIIFSNSSISGTTLGMVLLVMAALSWASGTIFYKKFLSGENLWTVNTLQYIFAIPVVFAMSILTGGINTSEILNPTFLMIVIYMGSLGTAVAYTIYLFLYRRFKAASISSFFYTVPALSLLYGHFIISETEGLQTILGFVVISIGILLSSRSVVEEESINK